MAKHQLMCLIPKSMPFSCIWEVGLQSLPSEYYCLQGTKDETDKEDDSKKPAPTDAGTGPSEQQPPPAAQQGISTQCQYRDYHQCLCVCVSIDKKEGEGVKKEEEEPKEKEEEVVVVEEMEIEEPDEPPRPSPLHQAITRFQEEVWPKISFLFTFTINRDGRVGTFLRVFGCIMAFLSCFTITYQVSPSYMYHSQLSFHISFFSHCLQAAFQNNKYQLWLANCVFEIYFIIEVL